MKSKYIFLTELRLQLTIVFIINVPVNHFINEQSNHLSHKIWGLTKLLVLLEGFYTNVHFERQSPVLRT